MRCAGALALLLAGAASAEPTRQLPKGLHAVPIQRGTAHLLIDGRPDDVPTALPAGWYFTAEGYDTLNTATINLQVAVKELEAKLQPRFSECPALEPVAPVIVQPQQGWSGRAVVLFFAAGVLLGAGGAYFLTR